MKGLNRLDGKVAVVTGSTKGIGRDIAAVFAREGAKVVVTGRSVDEGHSMVEEIISAGGEAMFFRTDITVEDEIKNLFKATEEKYGRLDILVNNAAPCDFVISGEGLLENLPTESWEYVMKCGITGAFWCCKQALPMMKKVGGGSIINISSMAGKLGLPGLVAYSSSKGAMNALTRQIAADYSPQGIRSNAIIISFVISETGEAAQQLIQNPEFAAGIRKMVLTKRLGRPEDVAYAALYLASDESGFITGVELPVDGGVLINLAASMSFTEPAL